MITAARRPSPQRKLRRHLRQLWGNGVLLLLPSLHPPSPSLLLPSPPVLTLRRCAQIHTHTHTHMYLLHKWTIMCAVSQELMCEATLVCVGVKLNADKFKA